MTECDHIVGVWAYKNAVKHVKQSDPKYREYLKAQTVYPWYKDNAFKFCPRCGEKIEIWDKLGVY